ncbi:MAG: carboxypeptidase-like regulatory domain-containing protein [Candidatus Hodarchaeota archaeon]
MSVWSTSIHQITSNSKINIPYDINLEQNIHTQDFSEDDYIPIIEDDKQALGNITITRFDFDEVGFFNNTEKYPDLDDDFISGALNITFLGINFTETKNIAQIDNLDNNGVDSRKITVVLNESLFVKYNTSIPNSEGYLIYGPRLYPCKLIQLRILSNGTGYVKEVPEANYSIDSSNFLKFVFNKNFIKTSHNFSMYLIWEYNLTIGDWVLFQHPEDRILITQEEQVVNALFHYDFSVIGSKFATNSLTSKVNADNLDFSLHVNPPDKELLENYSLEINNITIDDFVNIDNSINISTTGNQESINLNFTTSYTIKFINPVEKSWAIDRLVKHRNVRERIYFPSLIDGPKHIILKYLMIYEKTIILDQVIQNSSLFERKVSYYDLNLTQLQEEFRESLIFTRNAIKMQGLKIILPYLIVGETNPVMFKYNANNVLLIKITDSINMPLVGVDLILYYYQKRYGTYISNDLIQPMAPVSTNENGEAVIRNLPNGNYTVMIYEDDRLIKESIVNTYQRFNYIVSDELHFPLVIMIFGAISGLFILLGVILYIQYKKRQKLK